MSEHKVLVKNSVVYTIVLFDIHFIHWSVAILIVWWIIMSVIIKHSMLQFNKLLNYCCWFIANWCWNLWYKFRILKTYLRKIICLYWLLAALIYDYYYYDTLIIIIEIKYDLFDVKKLINRKFLWLGDCWFSSCQNSCLIIT